MEVRCWGQEARTIILAQETRWAWQQTKKMKCCRRLKIHSLLQKLVDEGRTTARAIADVKLAYGAAKLVTQFSKAIWLIPTHPSLNPLPQRRNDPPLRPPRPPLHLEGVVVAIEEGVLQPSCQDSAGLAPTSDPPLFQG